MSTKVQNQCDPFPFLLAVFQGVFVTWYQAGDLGIKETEMTLKDNPTKKVTNGYKKVPVNCLSKVGNLCLCGHKP